MRYWDNYPPYVPVAEKKARADRQLKQLMKKGAKLRPVRISGNTLARTWWGKAWNRNLEGYADYSNRIGRGRSYVRHGAVLDLKIAAGRVNALVQGSRSKPYEIAISIAELGKEAWREIKSHCNGQLKSMQDLLAGKFPQSLGEVFLARGKGLFPAPREIKFNCSCPDWASMCKHVAATLYGIGARLDEEPSLFFTLRKVEVEELVAGAVRESTDRLLAGATQKSGRVIADGDLSNLFGIELAEEVVAFPVPEVKPAAAREEKPARRTTARKSTAKTKPPAEVTPRRGRPRKLEVVQQVEAPRRRGRPPKNEAAPPAGTRRGTPVKVTATPPVEIVAALIKKSKKGLSVDGLIAFTGLTRSEISKLLQQLKRQGRIRSKEKGLYIGVKNP